MAAHAICAHPHFVVDAHSNPIGLCASAIERAWQLAGWLAGFAAEMWPWAASGPRL